ncbi:conjugal transfer protein TraX [Tissierella sp. MSJ-40]|uniref:Conjugal transfer protein TraX n=1 Tax=Tissierella simiarum TaxID=2841534 RepID=A0ABS6E4R8_9FIRM|nr:TraX family protein [Tissierella simiarum]MBU5437913.1 conjugal transfer protein TraX [Tissierella simiarum]
MQFFDGFTLKLIMVVLMVFDHVAQFIPNTPYWFHWLGRLVAPIFFYLLVEGYEHTRNRNAYMMRLFKWEE